MPRYQIAFNDNGDTIDVTTAVGGMETSDAEWLWNLADAVAADTAPIRSPGYGVGTITRLDQIEDVPRP